MTYKIIISPQVDMELEEIAIFIAKDNPTRAISFINEMLDNILSRLTNFPCIGKPYKSKQRMITFRGYVSFYEIDKTNKTINISHILNPAKYTSYKNLI